MRPWRALAVGMLALQALTTGAAEPVRIAVSLQNAKNGQDNVTLAPGDTVSIEQTPATAVVGGWTKIFSPTVVNELRIGYNNDNSVRQSNFVAEDVNRELGLETAPSLVGTGKYGFASLSGS